MDAIPIRIVRPPDHITPASRHRLTPPESITVAAIDLSALRSNARVLSAAAKPASLMAIIKANAYGHGAVAIARALSEEGIDFFAVATVAEAWELRNAGINERILVLASPLPEQYAYYEPLGLEMTVARVDTLRYVLEQHRGGINLPFHIKLDTGMTRLGLSAEEFQEAAVELRSSGAAIAGIWTHLASADDPSDSLTAVQIERFSAAVRESGLSPRETHVMNTGALTAGVGIKPVGERVRVGISLFGATGFPSIVDGRIRPVMTFRTRIVQVRTVDAGTGVSYGHRWHAPRATRIATVGAGYADGYPRVLVQNAKVGVGSRLCPIAGTVCMDMFMVDLGPDATEQPGDPIVLFGSGGPTVDEAARWAGTIPYELLCRVGRRVPRVYG